MTGFIALLLVRTGHYWHLKMIGLRMRINADYTT